MRLRRTRRPAFIGWWLFRRLDGTLNRAAGAATRKSPFCLVRTAVGCSREGRREAFRRWMPTQAPSYGNTI